MPERRLARWTPMTLEEPASRSIRVRRDSNYCAGLAPSSEEFILDTSYVKTMASYNRWMNEKLYSVCAELTDDERKADSGAYFSSIHGTLNHLLLADRVWMGRFTGRPFRISGLDQELYSDFSELRAQRAATDTEIERWASGVQSDALAGKLEYRAIVSHPESVLRRIVG
jgi:uncharacterized damage-inducible protein DinB